MGLSAREIAERLKATGPGVEHRHGTVVSVEAGHTCTVTLPGSAVNIPNVRYSASVCPRPGARVVLEAVGGDLYAVDTIAPVGPAFCSVVRTTDFPVATGTNKVFQFGASPVVTDEWGMIGTNELVVRVAGVYIVSFAWAFEGNATGYRSAGIAKNGVLICRDRRLSVAAGAPTCGTTVTQDAFAVGDSITVEVLQNSGVSLNLVSGAPDRSRLTATWLGPA